jgi:hypothetical protein
MKAILKMKTSFCIMTFHEIYDPKKNESSARGRWINHRILTGEKDNIKTLEAILNEKVKGDFELQVKKEATNIVVNYEGVE